MTREDPQIKLRLPEGMRDRIAELAKQNGRSMNSEIVARLEESLSNTGRTNLVATVARLSIALALANSHRLGEQTRSMVLHRWVRLFGERLLPLVEGADHRLAEEIKFALQETAKFFHSPQELQHQLTDQAVALRDALTHFGRLGGAEEEDPALEAMFATLIGDESNSAAAVDTKPPRPRIRRAVSKKNP